jgi:hypothetical protein
MFLSFSLSLLKTDTVHSIVHDVGQHLVHRLDGFVELHHLHGREGLRPADGRGVIDHFNDVNDIVQQLLHGIGRVDTSKISRNARIFGCSAVRAVTL